MQHFKKKEGIILILFSTITGYFLIGNDQRTITYLYFSTFLYLSSILLFLINAFYFYSKSQEGEKLIKLLCLDFFCVAGLYFPNAFFYGNYIQELQKLKDNSVQIFSVNNILSTGWITDIFLMHLLLFAFLGFLYGFFRRLIINRKFSKLRKIAIYTSVGLLILSGGFYAKYIYDTNWTGNEQIHFLPENQFSDFKSLIAQPQFFGKIIYVDLWFSSCGPCREEFKSLPNLKKMIPKDQIVFLYLGQRTSPPNHEQLWKNAIKKYNLTGWHIYMNPDLQKDIWSIIFENTNKKRMSYPHYLVINNSNNKSLFDAPRPSNAEKLLQELEVIQKP